MAVLEKLIEIVKEYPILYDLADENYKNIRKKDKVWQEIALELGGNGEELKKKWKNLRDSYAKHLRSLKTTTGQSARQKLYKWQWAKQMEAFRPFMAFAQTASNIRDITGTENTEGETYMTDMSPSSSIQQDERTSDIEINSETEGPSTSAKTPISSSKDQGKADRIKRMRKNEQAQQDSPTAAVIKYLKEKPKPNRDASDMDAIDLIFSGYAKTVKTFSPRLQVAAKLKIAELMSHLELEDQQERIGFVPIHSSTRSSSAVSDTIGNTIPLPSPSFSTGKPNIFQVPPVGTGTSQTSSNVNHEGNVPFTPFIINQPYASPYAQNSQSRQSSEINYQKQQSGMASSSLLNYVNNYDPSGCMND